MLISPSFVYTPPIYTPNIDIHKLHQIINYSNESHDNNTLSTQSQKKASNNYFVTQFFPLNIAIAFVKFFEENLSLVTSISSLLLKKMSTD